MLAALGAARPQLFSRRSGASGSALLLTSKVIVERAFARSPRRRQWPAAEARPHVGLRRVRARLDRGGAAVLFLFEQVAHGRLAQAVAAHDAVHVAAVQRLVARQRFGQRLDAVAVGLEQLARLLVELVDQLLDLLVDRL